jgi:hypothetical protein
MPRRIYKKNKKYDPKKDPKARDKDRDNKAGKMGNPAVVETYEDARENAMLNRNVPTMSHGGEAKVRGMGAAIKGGKFEGVF